MHKLINFICDELEELERKVDKQGGLSMAELQYGDMLAHFEKSLLTSEAMKNSDYSKEWDEGYSGSRRRDSMGRFVDGSSYNRYYDDGYSDRRSYEGNYSGRRYSRDEGKTHMVHEFEKLMDNATTQEEREVIQSALNRLKNV